MSKSENGRRMIRHIHPHIHTSTHPHIHPHYSAVNSHSSLGPPSLRSSTHSLRSFIDSLPQLRPSLLRRSSLTAGGARVCFMGGLPPLLVYRTKFPPLGGGTPAPPPPHPQNRHFKKFQNRLVLDCDWEVWDNGDGDGVVVFGGD